MGKKYWLKKILKYLGIVFGSFFGVVIVAIIFAGIYYGITGSREDETGVIGSIAFLSSFVIVALVAVLITYIRSSQNQRKFDIFLNEIAKGNFDVEFKTKKKGAQPENVVAINKLVKELKNNQMLKSDFIYGYSHEMKTPLASIRGYAELLLEDKELSEEERNQYLTIIKNETIRLSNLSKETMLISKLNDVEYNMEKEEFYIDSLIEECVLLMDNDLKKVNGKVELDLIHEKIFGSKSLMKEVFINLISNSIKYKKETELDIRIIIRKTINELCISFSDNGIGIAKDNIKYIFNKFYQVDKTKHTKGIGLGLSIVQRIVELHNGRIEVNSIQDEGTTFDVCLPFVEKKD